MKHNEELNKTIDAVLSEHAPLTAKQRVTVRELLLDAIEDAGFNIQLPAPRPDVAVERVTELVRHGIRNTVGNDPSPDSAAPLVPANWLQGLESMYRQTYADPNADNDYLRGYNNGIRLAYATLYGHEPKFIEPVHVNDTRPTILRPASGDYNKAADAVTWPDENGSVIGVQD